MESASCKARSKRGQCRAYEMMKSAECMNETRMETESHYTGNSK